MPLVHATAHSKKSSVPRFSSVKESEREVEGNGARRDLDEPPGGNVRLTKRRALLFTALTSVFIMAIGGAAFAAEPKPVFDGVGTAPSDVEVSLNMLWILIGAMLVIFMQAGFALVETGFTRAKHAAHVVSTNFAIFGLGFVGFFLIGFIYIRLKGALEWEK